MPAIDDYIDAASEMLAITIEEAWRPAIRFNLEVTFRFARIVDEFPLLDETEPASVFTT